MCMHIMLLIRCISFLTKNEDISLDFSQNHLLWCSFEASRKDASNEYPQHRFWLRNKKDTVWIAVLSRDLPDLR